MAFATACSASSPAPITVHPRFDPMLTDAGIPAETWLAFPFPADFRRLPNGNVDFSDFPNPNQSTLLGDWANEATSTIDGFSTQGMTYFAFDGALDVSTLSSTAGDYRSTDAPFFLVDVTPTSPTYGEFVPLRWHYFALDGLPAGTYVARDTLAIGPAWGFPLREGTTYALVVHDAIHAADGGRVGQPRLLSALLADEPTVPAVTPAVDATLYDDLRADYAPLRAYLAAQRLASEHIVDATVFTTQTYSTELAAIAAQIRANPSPPVMTGGFDPQGAFSFLTESFRWTPTATVNYDVYSGVYVAPNYQEGTIPYDTGGGFHFVGGQPEPVFQETIAFDVTVPQQPPPGGLPCYPIVIYGHGTGGDRTHMRRDGTAGRLAARGMAGISIDMPMHGVRAQGMSFDVSVATFNFFNAAAFRTNFRQGAVDLVSLVRFVRESLAVPATDSRTGQPIAFCTDRVGYMGHSQGGLTGALAIPFVPDLDTFMLSGAGGGLGITLINRKDPIDFGQLLKATFWIPDGEDWGEEHPLITLAQTLAEISDPSAYARYWNVDTHYRSPVSVMLTSGEHDKDTPYRTATTLALAAHLPVTTPVMIPIPEYDYIGLAPAMPTVSGNTAAGTTMGMLQFTADPQFGSNSDTHFLVFHRPEAIDASMEFLRSGLYDGTPVIRRNAASDAK